MFLQNVGMFMGPLPDIINVDITVLIVHLDFRQSLVPFQTWTAMGSATDNKAPPNSVATTPIISIMVFFLCSK